MQQPPAKLPESKEEQEKIIKLLEERLEKHDENRKTAQDKLHDIRNKLAEQINELEDRINNELDGNFTFEDNRLQEVLNELHMNNSTSMLQDAKTALRVIQSYEIIETKRYDIGITALYKLKTERRIVHEDDFVEFGISEVNSPISVPTNATKKSEVMCNSDKLTEERDHLVTLLKERLKKHDENRRAVQDKLHEVCGELHAEIDKLEERINKELEEKFIHEDSRLQAALHKVRENDSDTTLQKVKAELLVFQSYELIENKCEDQEFNTDFSTLYKLKIERRLIPELMEMRKATNIRVTGVNKRRVYLNFTYLNPDEERVLSDHAIVNPVKFKCLLFKKGRKRSEKEYFLDNNNDHFSFSFTPDTFEAGITYGIKVKMAIGDRENEWSDDVAEFIPEIKECCVWEKCPDNVDEANKYRIDEKNPRIASYINDYYSRYCDCTIIGDTSIPPNTVTSWNIKVLKSENNDGYNICIGVASLNANNYEKCVCYFDCWDSSLHLDPSLDNRCEEYGPRKRNGQYVHAGDSVGVVMDTKKGELSFVLNNVNLGVAYKGIPLDKPLVPWVTLGNRGDSIELDFSEIKENADSSIPAPSSITAESTTWDSITLAWDWISNVSFYQIKVDGSKFWHSSTTTESIFTKRGLLPDTEHRLRVRAVEGSSVSKWSSAIKVRTLDAPKFSECAWKECPDYVDDDKKYVLNWMNSRIVTSNNKGHCTVIGNTFIPLNSVISWSIKILRSENNDGNGICVGVAPFDINQNEDNICYCGWYFDCYNSELCSGPPHNYMYYVSDREPIAYLDGTYVHNGDSVDIAMDTTKCELSFALNGADHDCYCDIPLDKPLVPCVILYYQGNSVELVL